MAGDNSLSDKYAQGDLRNAERMLDDVERAICRDMNLAPRHTLPKRQSGQEQSELRNEVRGSGDAAQYHVVLCGGDLAAKLPAIAAVPGRF